MNTAITDATLSSDTIFATPVADEHAPASGRSILARFHSGYYWSRASSPGWIVSARITAGVSGIFTRSATAALLWLRALTAMRNGNSLTA